ncbi:MAG TPA: hypothetical protein VJ885_12215 [Thermoanaerobaculia bacterium]|nr:hypothetical protein [Thermoanaerobaculia bacterium]
MKKSLVTFVGGLCIAALLVPVAAQAASSVTIKNKSDWSIEQFFLAPVETEEWGPDQLGEEVIGTGDTFTLTGVPCDSYDVRLVDETGDVCIVTEVDICADGGWVISSDDLIDCAEATDQDE